MNSKLNIKRFAVALVLLMALSSSAAFAVDRWTTFRQDKDRTGYVEDLSGTGVLGPYRPAPIWVYPVVEDYWGPIDNSDAAPAFTISGSWDVSTLAIDPYGGNCLATTTDGAGSKYAKWTFEFVGDHLLNSKSGKASYYVYVWIPSKGDDEPDRAEDAHYTVSINGKVITSMNVDQRDGGWVQLGYRSYTVIDADFLAVTLTNKTELTQINLTTGLEEPKAMTVVADEVMITQDSGTINSSPAVCANPDPANPLNNNHNVLISCSSKNLGLAETDYSDASRFTGWITGLGTEPDSGITSINPTTGVAYADDRGIPKWTYPAEDRNWIVYGISATPTIVNVGAAEMAVIPAADSQVYVIEASRNYTNDIAVPTWQGPGYIRYNPTSIADGVEGWVEGMHAGFQQKPSAPGEVRYYQARAIAPPSNTDDLSTAIWTQDVNPVVDRDYNVEVWIPPIEGTEYYISDATYTIELTIGAKTTKRTVRLNQRNGGLWMSLGDDYRITQAGGTIKVTLTNQSTTDLTAQEYWVAADAMRVLPTDIGWFEFSSPVVDTSGGNINIYVGTMGGRVCKLTVDNPEPVWTYPTPDKPPIGPIYASITEYGGYLYVGSQDGHLYCLDKVNGTERWVYPSTTADPPQALAEISSTAAFGDNIYIATGAYHGGQMGTGWKTSEGRIICIKDDLMFGAQLQWVYPAMGALPAGSFLYASPLWMSPLAADPTGVFLGSLDGYFYGVDAAGTPANLITSDKWQKINVGGSMMSSPAGTRASFPRLFVNVDGTDNLDYSRGEFGAAFVNAGDTLYAIDLGIGKREGTDVAGGVGWQWQLMGSSISSPAIYNARIYTGDGAGYMWAFSTRDVAGGAEGWNTETGMTGPPTRGSEGDKNSQNMSRQAAPKIDVFSHDDYYKFLEEAKKSRTSNTPMTPADFDLDNPPNAITKSSVPIIHEWGEDIYFVVWGILDPNRKNKIPDQHSWPGHTQTDPADPLDPPTFQQSIEGGHKVDVVIKSREPGKNADSTITHTLSGKSINYFVSDTETVINPATLAPEPAAVWYAAYPYVLDGSSQNDPQTPSSILNVYCQESPVSPDRRSETIWIENPDSTADPKEPQQFAINNPLAIVYAGNYGSNLPCYIGVDSVLQTRKDRLDAQVNGNGGQWPVVWGGITPHNRPSQARTVVVSDRSLLGTHRNSTTNEPERKITRFRMDRDTLCWTGDVSRAVNFIGVWEKPPQDQRLHGRRYANPDYPDIGVRQVAVNMAAGGQDPSQGIQELPPIDPAGLVDPITQWTVLADPVNVVINVPKYQPANMPDNPNSPSDAELNASGYDGEVYAYVDSNNNGVFDGPARLGVSALSAKSEAYREMGTKVHVPIDRRVELSPDRMDMGELPIGFGFTDKSGTPFAFLDSLMYNPIAGGPTANVSPAVDPTYGFHEWFHTFKAENVGNTNLLNVQVERTNLFSDTVQYPFYDLSTTPPPVIPGSGHVVPFPCIVTTLDGRAISPPAAGFPVEDREGFYGLNGIPPVPDMPDYQRTFHKPLVGGQPSELKLPDIAPRFNAWKPNQFVSAGGSPLEAPQPAAVGVALPIGQPAGTYYGKIRLWDLPDLSGANPLPAIPVSEPMEIVVKATEARLTDGYPFDTDPHKAPHLPQLDVPGTPPTPGTGDAMPAAYRDRSTGDIHLFWTSSRFAMETADAASVNPTASDPWYIYRSTLKTATTVGAGFPGSWVETSGHQQWWKPVTTGDIFPAPATIDKYFPAPVAGDRRGGEGTVIPGTVRFSSPSVALDESSGKSWLFFMGQASKDNSAAAVSTSDVRRTTESRVYYTELNDGDIDPAQVFSISPKTSAASANNIAGDWTTPKFGVKGMVLKPAGGPSQLWSLWYGGNADRWRIYYNANPNPSDPAKWTNEAPLPLPNGLNSAAEPSPVAWWHGCPSGCPVSTGDTFDVVYSAFSVFHKNADIYLSRYKADPTPATAAKGGHWPVALQLLPQRRAKPVDIDGALVMCDMLTRDATRGVWFARDVDWDSQIVSFTEKPGPPPTPPSFEAYIQVPEGFGSRLIYKLNFGPYTKDPATGVIAFDYNPNAGGLSAADSQYIGELRTLFRAVVINPTDGTVKFLKIPPSASIVFAKYRPKAYRLTDDPAADTAPCAVVDSFANLRYVLGSPPGNPFVVPSGWSSDQRPPTDRVWVVWRRPGVGICYKTMRYAVQLDHQLALKRNTYEPDISGVTGIGANLTNPVEVDWTKNRLYFDAPDAVTYVNVTEGGVVKQVPVPNQVEVTYTDAVGNTLDETHFVEMIDEEMGPSGKTFGNLTNLALNESQVSAFKDPWDNKLWVFWTSTRSGNPDLYYETISPLFYGTQFKASGP